MAATTTVLFVFVATASAAFFFKNFDLGFITVTAALTFALAAGTLDFFVKIHIISGLVNLNGR